MSFKSTGIKSRPERVKPPQESVGAPSSHQTQSRRSSSASSIASFHSAHFPPEEEARLLSVSNELKLAANAQFSKQDFSSALSTYDRAVAECPNYLDYELAVLSSNVAACYLKLEEWRDALQAAEKGMDGLERVLPMPKVHQEKSKKGAQPSDDDKDAQIIELPEGTTDADDEKIIKDLDISDQRKADIHRIRTKLLLRRGRARYMMGINPPAKAEPAGSRSVKEESSSTSTWSSLSSAQADYQLLSTPEYFASLPMSDKKTVQTAITTLPPLIERAKEKEVGEMMGKLKELGNGILKPFGLSTDMFRMEKDEKSGGMSLKFDGKAGTK